jgi:uncharacterized protein YjiS (DUF1127 family)
MDTISVAARRNIRAVEPARPRGGFFSFIGLWWIRARSRRDLRLLLTSPQVLSDLGLTPEEADREAMKPFWR